MSFAATNWAWKKKVGSPMTKILLMALADHANPDGKCWPSQEFLAEETEMSLRSVRTHLEILEGKGLIRREERMRSGGQYKSHDIYLMVDQRQDMPEVPAARAADGTSGNSGTPPAATDVENQRQELPTNLSLEPSLEPSEDLLDFDFNRIKEAYPPRGNQPMRWAETETRVRELIAEGADPDALVASVKLFSGAMAGKTSGIFAPLSFFDEAKRIWEEYIRDKPPERSAAGPKISDTCDSETAGKWQDLCNKHPVLFSLKLIGMDGDELKLVKPGQFLIEQLKGDLGDDVEAGMGVARFTFHADIAQQSEGKAA